jgi:hypothetical protein
LAATLACSGKSGGDPGTGSAQGGADGVSGAEAGAGPTLPGGAGSESGGSYDTSAGAANAAGAGGAAGGFAQLGVCGQRGRSPVDGDSFEGYEEYYLIGDDGFGVDICVVRFAVNRIGPAPAGCDECAWTHQVEYSNPEVLEDVDGVCANSELGLDSARIDEIDGSIEAYGFVYEYAGHVSVLMRYDEASASWGPNGNASWSEATGELRFTRPDGFCGY